MSDLWIVLLDSSGSMGQPMSSTSEFSGRLETTRQTVKLRAAKEQLLRELPGFGGSAIAIVSFNDEPALLYSGAASEVDAIRDALVTVTPGGNTNIAAALEEALAVIGTRQPDRFANLMLLSDGLSTVGDPLLAASKCRAAHVAITTVLIDPTDEGAALARAISQYFYGVGSAAELERAIAASAGDHAKRASASRAEDTHFLMRVVATLAAVLGLSTAIAGFLATMVEKPTTALPIAGAAVALLASCISVYVFVAKKRSGVGFFRNSTDSEPYFPWVPRFPRPMRLWSLVTGSLCLILSLGLLWLSYRNSTTAPARHIPTIEAEVRFLATSEGGRAQPLDLRSPSRYRPQIVLGDARRSDAVSRDHLVVEFCEQAIVINPGQTALVRIRFSQEPGYWGLAPGSTFVVQEGTKIVASGTVLDRSDPG